MKILNIKSIIVIFAFLFITCIAFAQSSTDYKIIKNAIQKENLGNGRERGIKNLYISVINNKEGKEEARIQVPLQLVEWFADSCKNTKINLNGKKKTIKIGELLNVLQSSGKTSLIEINDYEENRLFKAWIE